MIFYVAYFPRWMAHEQIGPSWILPFWNGSILLSLIGLWDLRRTRGFFLRSLHEFLDRDDWRNLVIAVRATYMLR